LKEQPCQQQEDVIDSMLAVIAKASRPSPLINPLLEKAFPSFFTNQAWANKFTEGEDHAGPWKDQGRWVAWTLHLPRDEDWEWEPRVTHMRPEASWRKMLPCWPPPSELRVRFFCNPGDVLIKCATLQFSNSGEEVSGSRPRWLTFGLLYDLAENAWFHGKPYFVESVQINLHDCRREDGTFCAGLDIYVGSGTAEERTALHHYGFAMRMRWYKWRSHQRHRKTIMPRFRGCVVPTLPVRPHIFTNEFHFQDESSFDDVEWVELKVYDMPVLPIPQPVPLPLPEANFKTGWSGYGWRDIKEDAACGLVCLFIPLVAVGYWIVMLPVHGISALRGRIQKRWRS
jgi:hypothetical protein